MCARTDVSVCNREREHRVCGNRRTARISTSSHISRSSIGQIAAAFLSVLLLDRRANAGALTLARSRARWSRGVSVAAARPRRRVPPDAAAAAARHVVNGTQASACVEYCCVPFGLFVCLLFALACARLASDLAAIGCASGIECRCARNLC